MPDTELSKSTESSVEPYIDPGLAGSYCAVFNDLESFGEQVGAEGTEGNVARLDERLKILADVGNKLATLSDSESSAAWIDMADEYSSAHDYFLSSGRQLANDEFLHRLARAVEAADHAFEHDSGRIQDECNKDSGQFVSDGVS
ncbi:MULTISPECIES: hypothetical protein [Actinomycetes]|uniref:Uncharacterized protein n=1 Tax=Actinocorallia glomerata TaxID=46203 RepID=A0ABP6PUE8_9ACTN